MRNHQTADILLTFAEEQFDGFLQHYAAEYAKANVVYKSRNLLWRAARVDLQKLKAEVLGQQALEAKQLAATRAGLPLGAGMAAQPKELLAEYVGHTPMSGVQFQSLHRMILNGQVGAADMWFIDEGDKSTLRLLADLDKRGLGAEKVYVVVEG